MIDDEGDVTAAHHVCCARDADASTIVTSTVINPLSLQRYIARTASSVYARVRHHDPVAAG